VGGFASAAYNRFGTATATHIGSVTTTNDLLISGDFEVDGSAAFDGFTLLNNASVSGNFELTNPSALFGINAGNVINTMFEVGGTASISGTTTLRGITYTWPSADGSTNTFLKTNGSGTLSWSTAGVSSNSLDFDEFVNSMTLDANLTINRGTGNYFIGIGSAPSTVFEVQGTASSSYLLTGNTLQVGGYASAAYSRFGTDSTGYTNFITTTNDVLISGDLEVNGSANFDTFLRVGTSQTPALYANVSTGNVGIGTTNPGRIFEVNGGSLNETYVILTNSAAGGGSGNGLEIYEGSVNANIWNYENGYIRFATNNTERLRIDSSGNVGIGTTSPGTKFDVIGAASISTNFEVTGGYASISNTLYVQQKGNVGIGTTVPVNLLEVKAPTATHTGIQVTAGTGTSAAFFRASNTGGLLDIGRESSGGGALLTGATGYAGVIAAGGTYPLQFGINDGIKMTILNSGNVGIGTTGPGQLLEVKRSTDGIVARFTDSDGSCDVNPNATSFSCASDVSLKKDIFTVSGSLDLVLGLRGVGYHWNSQTASESYRYGFVAQEVEAVIPELVATDPVTGLKSVNYTGFSPFLVGAIKELDLKIASLSAQFSGKKLALGDDFVIPEDGIVEAGGTQFDIFLLTKGVLKVLKEAYNVVIEWGLLKIAEIVTDKITAKEICLEEVCMTKEQLSKLLQTTNQLPTLPLPSLHTVEGAETDLGVAPTSGSASNAISATASTSAAESTSDNVGTGTPTPPANPLPSATPTPEPSTILSPSVTPEAVSESIPAPTTESSVTPEPTPSATVAPSPEITP
ncbi:MAG: tail fiber domain-containing protein, partial [Patescibacteria group bacterium]